MSDKRVHIEDSPITHAVSWSDYIGGRTRCGRPFTWGLGDRRAPEDVKTDCDCMTCLVGRTSIRFEAHQYVGTSVINIGAFSKLDFFDPEPVK
jgi:hypothetical protein